MINYLFEVTLAMGVCYAIYALWLRNETFFQLNRWYLLGTPAICLLVPLCDFSMLGDSPNQEPTAMVLDPIVVTVQQLEQSLEEIVVTPVATTSTLSIQSILLWIYGIVAIGLLLRFGFGLWQIFRLARRSRIVKHGQYFLAYTDQIHLPFSFFNFLFWSEKIDFPKEEQEKILEHELSHIRGGHSIDVLLLELLCVFLWCSPFIFLYKKSLRNVHEYLADAAVLRDTPTQYYGRLLLKQFQSGSQIALAHHFFHSQLKNRIIMMTKNKSSHRARLKYLAIIPALLLMTFILSSKNMLSGISDHSEELALFDGDFDKEKVRQQLVKAISYYNNENTALHQEKAFKSIAELTTQLTTQYPDHVNEIVQMTKGIASDLKVPITFTWAEGAARLVRTHDHASSNDAGEQIFKVVEEMPQFPGCEQISNADERKTCAQRALLKHIYSNIKYPVKARDNDIEGVVLLNFIVREDGMISNLNIKKDIGGGCGEEVLRVARLMPQWIPGKQKGEPVAVEFNLPVKFRLDGESKTIIVKDKNTADDLADMEVFQVVEEMPRFPGCEDIADKAARDQCARKKMLEFIYGTLTYPKAAKEANIEGMTVVRFVVDKEGNIVNPEMIRSIGGGTDEVVLETVLKMNEMEERWIPGKQKGKAVNVVYNLPVKFKLVDDTPTEAQVEAPVTKPVENTLQLNKFDLYPNPSAGKINIDLELPEAGAILAITDMNGKLVHQQKLSAQQMKITDLDVSSAAAGPLFINILHKGKSFTYKAILQK